MHENCRKMPTTYIVQIMVSSYHRQVIGGWTQFVNVKNHVKATGTINEILQFLPFVSQQCTIHAMVGSLSTVLSMTGNTTLHIPA
jgi:hypothetical protein